jgi:hypothetical protein
MGTVFIAKCDRCGCETDFSYCDEAAASNTWPCKCGQGSQASSKDVNDRTRTSRWADLVHYVRNGYRRGHVD